MTLPSQASGDGNTMSENHEWIEWRGYSDEVVSPPLAVSAIIDLKTRGGRTFEGQRIGAGDWDHSNDGWDVVAYRLHVATPEQDERS